MFKMDTSLPWSPLLPLQMHAPPLFSYFPQTYQKQIQSTQSEKKLKIGTTHANALSQVYLSTIYSNICPTISSEGYHQHCVVVNVEKLMEWKKAVFQLYS